MFSPRARLQAFFSNRDVRELLLWCLPALLVGFALRLMLTIHLPYAYYHDDAPDFLCTTEILATRHHFELHEKKTFLVPTLYTLAFATPVPAAITVPIFQHLSGLGLILMLGALCRLWLTHWKIWIIPVTVLAAINPIFLWFEHTFMAETVFVFCFVLVALAGTLYARRPTWRGIAFLSVALVLLAGARPEGKLLFGFGLLLVLLVHRQELRTCWPRLAVLAAVALLTHLVTKTTQAGLLLYTSVARLTPTDLRCAPGFDPYIAPMRKELQSRWDEYPQFPAVRDRKAISAVVKQYLADHRKETKVGRSTADALCMKMARETCLRNLASLPAMALTKFRLKATESPAGNFDNEVLFEKQQKPFLDNLKRTRHLAPGLLGVELRDEAAIRQWIDTHYGEVPWFNALMENWMAAVNRFHLPDERYSGLIYPGIPLYFVAGTLGMLALMLRPGKLQRFHTAWGLTVLGFFFVIMLTANVRSRFRFVFEPFWFLYIALLAECLWISVRALFPHRLIPPPPQAS